MTLKVICVEFFLEIKSCSKERIPHKLCDVMKNLRSEDPVQLLFKYVHYLIFLVLVDPMTKIG